MNKVGLGTLHKQQAQQVVDTGPQLQPAEERRRSQRVMIQIPVVLEMTSASSTTKTTMRAKTASVNDHGAMLLCTKNLPVETKLDLVNERTAQKQSCRVTRAAIENQQGYLVPVEFSVPAPGFWHISFPPPGWKALEN